MPPNACTEIQYNCKQTQMNTKRVYICIYTYVVLLYLHIGFLVILARCIILVAIQDFFQANPDFPSSDLPGFCAFHMSITNMATPLRNRFKKWYLQGATATDRMYYMWPGNVLEVLPGDHVCLPWTFWDCSTLACQEHLTSAEQVATSNQCNSFTCLWHGLDEKLIHMCTYTYICIHMHIYIYIYIHVYTSYGRICLTCIYFDVHQFAWIHIDWCWFVCNLICVSQLCRCVLLILMCIYPCLRHFHVCLTIWFCHYMSFQRCLTLCRSRRRATAKMTLYCGHVMTSMKGAS